MKIQSVEKITDLRYLNMFEMKYQDAEGRNRVWCFASRNNPPQCVPNVPVAPDAVVIVPFHAEKNRLVIILKMVLQRPIYFRGMRRLMLQVTS